MSLEIAKQFYSDLIEDLIENFDLDYFLDNPEKDVWREWYDQHENALWADHPGVVFSSGISKGVIISRMTGYVIKFPFSNVCTDYCALEVANYAEACKENLEECFAWCDKFTTVKTSNGMFPVYIMEYAECDEEGFSSYVMNTYPNIASDHEFDCSDEMCVEDVLAAEFGGELFERFIEFCDEWSITDKHGGNIGKINGKFVMTDYSGYMG